MRVALGLKARTGRAIVVAVGGDVLDPQLVERSQMQLLPDGAWAPYHAAEGLEPADARESVARSIESAHRLAATGIREVGAGRRCGDARPDARSPRRATCRAMAHHQSPFFRNAGKKLTS
jgi:hypothetical protein